MKPALGDIVIYRNRDGVDMPAIVTGLGDTELGYVHLHQFPPPGAAADQLDPHWGVPAADHRLIQDGVRSVDALVLPRQTWRWPEHMRT